MYTSMEAVSASPNANNRPPQETREEIVSAANPVPDADERRITTQDFEDATAVKSSNNTEVKAKHVEAPVTSNDHSQPEEERTAEQTSELQSQMSNSYDVSC